MAITDGSPTMTMPVAPTGMMGGSSYRRKRDPMGRYSRDDGYSRDGHAKDVIERMMQDTDDPNVKEALRQCMHVVEKG